jgi:hypothetical protein
MMLFPNHMPQQVLIHCGELQRIAIAFNLRKGALP